MSTFTEWNGPPPVRGPSTKDVLALIDAYNNANATLVQHLAGTAADDVHRFNTALKEAIAALEKRVNGAMAGKAEAGELKELADRTADNAKAIAEASRLATSAEESLAEAVAVENRRALKKELELDEAVAALEAALDSFKETYLANSSRIEYDGDATTTVTGIVSATEYLIGVAKTRRFYDIVEWRTFNAQYAGTGTSDGDTDTNGLYILGRMSDEWIPDMGFEDKSAPKTARAHIKYINSRPFDLLVDMAATSAEEGSITCLASFEKPWTLDDPADAWEDMTLHLLVNADATGHAHVFLAISAKGLSGQSTTFHAAGENFIPGGNVNGVSSRIAFTRVKQGFNGNRANLDDLRVEALGDAYGKTILKVEYSKDTLGLQHKDLYIADPSFNGIYFLKRPSVIFTSDTDDTENDGEEIRPVLTSADLDAISSGKALAGIIVFWPLWEEAEAGGRSIRKATNVPVGWLPCDGSEVSSEDYPSLFEALGISDSTWTLPIADHAIIRVKTLFEDIGMAESTADLRVLTHKELTEAIISIQDAIDGLDGTVSVSESVQASLEQEIADRQSADEQLQASLEQEIADRQSADGQLQSQIDALDERKADVWTGTQQEFDSEKSGLSDGTIVLSEDELEDT